MDTKVRNDQSQRSKRRTADVTAHLARRRHVGAGGGAALLVARAPRLAAHRAAVRAIGGAWLIAVAARRCKLPNEP